MSNPKAVRFTADYPDLLPWYEGYAETEGISVNAALMRGLSAHRAAVMRARERAAARAEARTLAAAAQYREGRTMRGDVSSA